MKLNSEHRQILESATIWLNSDVITAAQITLKDQLGVPGFQHCELVKTGAIDNSLPCYHVAGKFRKNKAKVFIGAVASP